MDKLRLTVYPFKGTMISVW